MKKCLKFLVAFFFTICIFYAKAQPFANEIAAFKKQDSISFPPKQAILFVGSSSFTIWKDVQGYFPGYTIINRGFGGSALTDVIKHQEDVIYPYQPKQIVIYCGENDIAGDLTVPGMTVYERFKKLYKNIKENLPGVPVVFISMKPSPSRWIWKDRMIDGNKLIRNFLKRKKKENDRYVDVWAAMLKSDGTPREDIFLEDMLHMNAKGYAIWQKIIEPYLAK